MKAYTEQSERQRSKVLDEFQKRKEKALNEDIQQVMSHPFGRRMVYWLIWSECGVMDGTVDSSIKDGMCAALLSWRYEGKRDVGMNLIEILKKVCLDKYVLMIQESTSDLQKELLLEVHTEQEMNRD